MLPARRDGAAGASLVLFLVLVTQLNDVAQYIWGKLFGRHKVMPTVSPNKTYEGPARRHRDELRCSCCCSRRT